MKAKEFMEQVQKIDCMIENKNDERERWRMLSMSTTASAASETGVRVTSSGSKQQMADAVIRGVDIGTEIEQTICLLFEARRQIISIIEQLTMAEYDLLHKVYVGKVVTDKKTGRKHIVYMTLQEVADEAKKSYSWATTTHGTALSHVQRIIDAQQIEPVGEQIKKWNCGKV